MIGIIIVFKNWFPRMSRESYEATAGAYLANNNKGLGIQKYSETVGGKRGRLMFEEPEKVKDGYLNHRASEPARIARPQTARTGSGSQRPACTRRR
jgi:hypothetical protein